LRISLFVIAAVLIAAHFLRQGAIVATVICLLAPLLFFYRRRLSLVVLQLAAYISAGIWVIAVVQIVQQRLAQGRPWGIAAMILSAVIVLTVTAGALLNSRSMREKYPR
jgi:branched-subunit amino acid transport protein AzlD